MTSHVLALKALEEKWRMAATHNRLMKYANEAVVWKACADELAALVQQMEAEPETRVCRNCASLESFEACDEIKTCPTLNIRIHTAEVDTFGCNLFEARS